MSYLKCLGSDLILGYHHVMKIKIAVVFLIFCAGDVFLNSLSAQTENNSSQTQVPVVMYDFLGKLTGLQPFMVSPQKFSSDKNEKEIERRLAEFAETAKRLSHNQRLSTTSFQISAQVLQGHLATVRDLFGQGRKDYARRMLNATIDGCSSCHTQVPSGKMQMWKFKADEIHGTDFDKAEFLFAVRHYDEALDYYNRVISKIKDEAGERFQIETALKRKLAIFVRAKQEPQQGVESFQKDLNNKKLSKATKTEVAGWIDALKKVIPTNDPSVSAETLENFASKAIPPLLTAAAQFKPGSYVMFLYTSGMIYHFINTHKESEVTPGLLYWLALCDNHLSQNYFFSLTDSYLKECISRFPSSKTAGKCYSELESITVEAYTGSSGVHLPKDVKEELQKYKAMLK